MKIDPSKKYKTRDGREVTMLHRVPEGWPTLHPWRGLVDGLEESWDDDGFWDESPELSDNDLVEVREPREFKLAINREDTRLVYARGVESLNEEDWEVIRVREIIEP